jgi:hypothetical protein
VRGNKAAARLAGAARALKARRAGHRAEAATTPCGSSTRRKRQQEAAADTVHLELTIAKRAYKLARVNGLVSRIPDFPRIRNLRVRPHHRCGGALPRAHRWFDDLVSGRSASMVEIGNREGVGKRYVSRNDSLGFPRTPARPARSRWMPCVRTWVSRRGLENANARPTGCMARIEQCVWVPEQEREI